ncbi:MAG: hypothetical protein AABW92_01315, partial [Nanoarchaeota archaeon]
MRRVLVLSIILLLAIFTASAALGGLLPDNKASSQNTVLSGVSSKINPFLSTKAESLRGEIPLIVQLNSVLSTSETDSLIKLGSKIKYEYNIINAVALSIDVSKLGDLAAL